MVRREDTESDRVGDLAAGDFELFRHLPHLLRRAHFEAEALFPLVYGEEVTSRQLALLTAVGQRPGLSQSAVAQQIGIDLNTCSDLVARLVAKKLLRRERSQIDGRTYALHLAPKGGRAFEEGIEKAAAYRESVSRRLPSMSGLSCCCAAFLGLKVRNFRQRLPHIPAIRRLTAIRAFARLNYEYVVICRAATRRRRGVASDERFGGV